MSSQPPTTPAGHSEDRSSTANGSENTDQNESEMSESHIPPSSNEIAPKPWKYVGYRGYARFISSDDGFLVFRKFDRSNTRIALRLQDEIVSLEEELEQCDEEHSHVNADDLHNGSFRQDEREDRTLLLDLLTDKLERHNRFMMSWSQMKKLHPATKRAIKQIEIWHRNYNNYAIPAEEHNYLNHPSDLVNIVQGDKTPIRRLMEKSRWMRTLSIWQSKAQQPEPVHYDINEVNYSSDDKLDRFASMVIVSMGTFMLILPLWLLRITTSVNAKLGIITAFVLLFLFLMSFALVTKPFEALGATAAYGAVLIVFIQV